MKSFYYCEHMQSYAGVDNETINSHKKIALTLVTRLKNIPHPFLSVMECFLCLTMESFGHSLNSTFHVLIFLVLITFLL